MNVRAHRFVEQRDGTSVLEDRTTALLRTAHFRSVTRARPDPLQNAPRNNGWVHRSGLNAAYFGS